MTIRSQFKTLILIAMAFSVVGCQRSTRQFIEDTKTAKQYSAQAFKSMGGKHSESRQVQNEKEFGWEYFEEEDSQTVQDHLSALDASDPYAQYRYAKNQQPKYEDFKSPDQPLLATFKTLYFDTNDDVIRGEANLTHAMKIADFMKEHKNAFLYIEGHCDSRGTAAYNLSLGSRRASSIRNFLIEQDVSPEHIFTISFGKEHPAVEGNDENAWKHNRRGEYKLLFQ